MGMTRGRNKVPEDIMYHIACAGEVLERRLNKFVDAHPAISFVAFMALLFGAIALVGVDDAGDRVRELGGM